MEQRFANPIKLDLSLNLNQEDTAPQTNTHKKNKPAMLEVPIFGAEHAQLAVSLGAGRLELNAGGSYAVGGTTPSLDELRALRTALGYESVPLRIMIRPRGGRPNEQDFIYSRGEFYAMCRAIVQFKESRLLRAENGDGFVFGVLKTTPRSNADGGEGDEVEVDVERNTNLVNFAAPFGCVFHRAFDDALGAADIQPEEGKERKERKALNEVRQCGFDGILTSGGKGNAHENVERLGTVLALARETAASSGGREEKRVEIIVGGGVRSGNLGGLRDALLQTRDSEGGSEVNKPECWFHSSCLTGRSGGLHFDGEEVKALVGGLSGA